MEFRERRRHRRFPLREPATIFYNDGEPHELAAHSRNVSLGGGLFGAAESVPGESVVQVQLILQREDLGKISLHGAGKVVRSETGADGEVTVAIEFDEKLSEA